MEKLKVVTLCSGYDSQCLALERLKKDYPNFDYELIAWSEFDPESKQPLHKQPAVIAHNALFPQWADRNLGDMTKIDWEKVPDFDLLFYSTPCQSISSAGLQHGFTEGSGTRSSIIWNVRDAVKIKKPKFLCLENVKAMVSKKFKPMFNLWQQELESLGYTNFAKVLNAKDYGWHRTEKGYSLSAFAMMTCSHLITFLNHFLCNDYWKTILNQKSMSLSISLTNISKGFNSQMMTMKKKTANNKRLKQLLSSGKVDFHRGGGLLDTYNQAVHYDVCTTIRTNINTANHHFILVCE